MPLVVVVAIGLTLLLDCFYLWRFRRTAPVVAQLSDEGIGLVYRTGEEWIAWDEVTMARHEYSGGLRWRVRHDHGEFLLRDDGFTTIQWERICATMRRLLEQHEVPFVEGAFAKFASS
ncbi:MAG: hypothetical protein IPK69_02800 [Phycisphaerales bacterium]|nr:MAG: hypothetical protein IPK69_02800 [Phycisphaerales bacterium]